MHAETATVGIIEKTGNTYAVRKQTSGFNQSSHKISQFAILSFTMDVSSVIHLWCNAEACILCCIML
jgi:peroxiredoxin